jgi:hypothetical protein
MPYRIRSIWTQSYEFHDDIRVYIGISELFSDNRVANSLSYDNHCRPNQRTRERELAYEADVYGAHDHAHIHISYMYDSTLWAYGLGF